MCRSRRQWRSVPLGELAQIRTVGPSGLRQVDGRRTVGLNINPPKRMSLQQAIDVVKRDVEPQIAKLMPADGVIRYAGNAGNLRRSTTCASTSASRCWCCSAGRGAGALGEGQRDHDADDSARKFWRRTRDLAAACVHEPDARSADDDRLHHPDGHGGQQRDPAHRRDPQRGTPRPPAARCDRRGAADPHTADLRDDALWALRHAAARDRPRPRQRALPGPRRRHRRRHGREYRLHPRVAAGAVAPR